MLNRRRLRGEGSSSDPKFSLTMAPRKSLLPPMKASFLRRGSEPCTIPASQKQPLLALTLSSPSFLDSSIVDEDSDSTQSLYRIKTSGTSTTVLRRDPTQTTVVAASIKWPKMIPLKRGKDGSDGVLLLMKDGRWSGGESLLKPASKEGARKFSIPHYNQPMKWKQHGPQYWCTTPTVQGPIATFEPRKGSQAPKLTVYETLHDKHDPSALSAFRGVSILLLDYLIVTSLLLVTDLQEWMLVRKYEDVAINPPHSSDSVGAVPTSAPGIPGAASNPQWRKIAFGEPIFPKIAGDAKSLHGEASSSAPSMLMRRQAPSIMTRSDGSSSSHRSPGFTMRSFMDTDPDSEDDTSSDETHYNASHAGFISRPLSATAESISSSGNAYVDSSFYRPPSPLTGPAVSSRPISGVSSVIDRHFRSQPSSPLSQSHHYSEEFPPPPLPHPVRRARSASPVSPTLDDPEVLTDILNGYKLVPNRPSRPFVAPPPPPAPRPSRSRSDSIGSSRSVAGRRPLPQPPSERRAQESAWVEVQELRRAQSSNGLLEIGRSHSQTPIEPRILPSSPRLQTSFTDSGPIDPSPSMYGASVASYYPHPQIYPQSHPQTPPHNPSPQHYVQAYDTDEVHGRQPPITKSSHEDLARWLHNLTTDSEGRIHTPEPLPNSTIYDVPPPAYSSITFTSRPTDGMDGPPVSAV